MPRGCCDEFVSEELETGEDVYRYRPGGLHPVHLDDELDGIRYKVVQKLGHGASSTVWLARDRSHCKYVASSWANPGSSTSNGALDGHSTFESFFTKFPPSPELRTSYHYTAPEVLFGWNASFHSDIWALGCLIFEMRAGFHLFPTAINNPPLEAVGQIGELLGKPPTSWNHIRFNEEDYLEQDGCKNHADMFDDITLYPLHKQVDRIKDEQFGLPNINIGLKGSKTSRERLRMPSSSAVICRNTHSDRYSDPHQRPIPLPRTGDMYLMECFSAQLLDQAAIKKDVAPSQIAAKESTSLAHLLSKILTYHPEDRISLRDIIDHPFVG